MSSAMMAIEGVLGDRDSFHINMQHRANGLRLYAALQQWFRLVLVTDGTSEQAAHWLKTQGLSGHAQVVARDESDGPETIDVRASQLRRLRANRTAVELVIDSQPLVITMAAAQGVTGMLFVPGRVGTDRTDLRRNRRDWESIEAELEHQAARLPVQTAETP